jgi:hypothetical protein
MSQYYAKSQFIKLPFFSAFIYDTDINTLRSLMEE